MYAHAIADFNGEGSFFKSVLRTRDGSREGFIPIKKLVGASAVCWGSRAAVLCQPHLPAPLSAFHCVRSHGDASTHPIYTQRHPHSPCLLTLTCNVAEVENEIDLAVLRQLVQAVERGARVDQPQVADHRDGDGPIPRAIPFPPDDAPPNTKPKKN